MPELYLIRHAESEFNLGGIICGRSDHIPLTPRGKTQAYLLGKRLHHEIKSFDHVFSSPSSRTRETAHLVCSEMNQSLDTILYSPALLELCQGEWEGQPRHKIYTPETLTRINTNNWEFRAPGGESQREVEERMHTYLEQNALTRDGTICIFTHGMAIKCLLRKIMDFTPHITYKIHINNTSITHLKYDTHGWHILAINDTAHLQAFD